MPKDDLQALLEFMLNMTKKEDVENSPEVQAMSEERKKFLLDALNECTVDIVQCIAECVKNISDPEAVKVINDPNAPSTSKQEDSLIELQEYIETTNLSGNFHQLGGLGPLKNCLKSPHVRLQTEAARLTGLLANNEPINMAELVQAGFIPVLTVMLKSPDPSLCRQTLFAISSILGGNDSCDAKAVEEFRTNNGVKNVIELFSRPNESKEDERMLVKACHFIQTLGTSSDLPEWQNFLKEFLAEGTLTLLIELLDRPRLPWTPDVQNPVFERAAITLSEILLRYPASRQMIKDLPDLERIIRKNLAYVKCATEDKDRYFEEIESFGKILYMTLGPKVPDAIDPSSTRK